MLIPLRVDVPMSRRPWANHTLMGVIVVVSIWGFCDAEFFCELAGVQRGLGGEGLIPRDTLPLPVLAVTSSLLHIHWVCLIVNMLFMWIFGDAVNYKFGHLGYVALYLASASAGSMVPYGYGGGPAVGASGAIFGVMGAFAVFFPKNDVTALWTRDYGQIPGIWVIVIWVAWSSLVVWHLSLGGDIGISLWAHIGGFCAGLAIGLTCALLGIIKPTQDEQTLLQLIGVRR